MIFRRNGTDVIEYGPGASLEAQCAGLPVGFVAPSAPAACLTRHNQNGRYRRDHGDSCARQLSTPESPGAQPKGGTARSGDTTTRLKSGTSGRTRSTSAGKRTAPAGSGRGWVGAQACVSRRPVRVRLPLDGRAALPAAEAEQPDPDPHRLGDPGRQRGVDGPRAHGRRRGARARAQRQGPRSRASPRRRGADHAGPEHPRRRCHLVAHGQRRRPGPCGAGARRVRLSRLDPADPARAAGLALPAAPGPQCRHRPHADRLDRADHRRAGAGAHRARHAAARGARRPGRRSAARAA